MPSLKSIGGRIRAIRSGARSGSAVLGIMAVNVLCEGLNGRVGDLIRLVWSTFKAPYSSR